MKQKTENNELKMKYSLLSDYIKSKDESTYLKNIYNELMKIYNTTHLRKYY